MGWITGLKKVSGGGKNCHKTPSRDFCRLKGLLPCLREAVDCLTVRLD